VSESTASAVADYESVRQRIAVRRVRTALRRSAKRPVLAWRANPGTASRAQGRERCRITALAPGLSSGPAGFRTNRQVACTVLGYEAIDKILESGGRKPAPGPATGKAVAASNGSVATPQRSGRSGNGNEREDGMRSGRLQALLVAGMALGAAEGSAQRVDMADQDRVLTSRPSPAWAAGADEGESWELLSGVQALAFDAGDRLYALDQGNYRILVFDAAGRFVRQFGKQGGGPGELQFPMGLTVLADGTVAILDMGRRGFSLFDGDGNYVRDEPLPEGIGAPRPNEVFAHPAGGVVLRAMPAFDFRADPPTGKQKSPVLRQPLDGGAMTVIHEFEMDAPRVVQPGSSPGGRTMRMVMFTRPTFGKEPTWGLLPGGGIAVSADGDYAIRTFDAAGRPGRVLARPVAGRKVTKRDQDAAREQRRKELKSGGGGGARVMTSGGGAAATRTVWAGPGGGRGGEMSEAEIEAQVAQMQFAEEIPAITRIVADATGRIWVERSPERVGDPAPVDLISPDGRYIGTLRNGKIPGAVSASGLAAWVENDPDTDIERIVVRRLPADWK